MYGNDVVVLAQRIEGRDTVAEAAFESDYEGQWEAIWVLVKPVPDVPLSGFVLDVKNGKATGETSDGNTETFTLPPKAQGVGPGNFVTVFRDHKGNARGVVRSEDVRIRLQNFLAEAEEEADEPQ